MTITDTDAALGGAAIIFAVVTVWQWRLRTDRGTVLAILSAVVAVASLAALVLHLML